MARPPTWFSPYLKPYAPSKPPKTLNEFTVVQSIYDPSKAEILEAVEKYSEEKYYWETSIADLDSGGVCLTITAVEQVPNTSYEEQMVLYKKDYSKYRERLSQWNILKAEWDEKEKAKIKAKELKELDRLEKKYKAGS